MLINHSNYYLLLTTACLSPIAYMCHVTPGQRSKDKHREAYTSSITRPRTPSHSRGSTTGTDRNTNRSKPCVRRGPVIIHHSVRRISNKSLNDSADVASSYNMTTYPDSSPSPNTEQPNLCFPPPPLLFHYYTFILLLLLYYCHTVRIPKE